MLCERENKRRSGKSRLKKTVKDSTEVWECPGEEQEREERQKLLQLLTATLLSSKALNNPLPEGETVLKTNCKVITNQTFLKQVHWPQHS